MFIKFLLIFLIIFGLPILLFSVYKKQTKDIDKEQGIVIEKSEEGKNNKIEVTVVEDLMREHGLLDRILIIYEKIVKDFYENNKTFTNLDILNSSANIIKKFIEDYHEKLEENYIFPLFEESGKLIDLVSTLRNQHEVGRNLTKIILDLSSKNQTLNVDENQRLIECIKSFKNMYEAHKSREDTVLFPEIKTFFTKEEYEELGEKFEDEEAKMFGEDGFEKFLDKISNLEKRLGIENLAVFTPKI